MNKLYGITRLLKKYEENFVGEIPLARSSLRYRHKEDYKYYYEENISIDFNLEEKKLLIESRDYNLRDEYRIHYPRYTSNGRPDYKQYFHFIFSVEKNKKPFVLIVKGCNVKDYKKHFKSKLRVDINEEKDYIHKREILLYQELIYRDLGLGMGIVRLDITKEELLNIGLSRQEFLYGIYHLILSEEIKYLANRFSLLGVRKEDYIEFLYNAALGNESGKKIIPAIGLDRRDYLTLYFCRKLEFKMSEIEKDLLAKPGMSPIKLGEIYRLVYELIYLDRLPSLARRINVMENLKFASLSIKDIDFKYITSILLSRVKDTGLSIIEILEIVLNYRRSFKEALNFPLLEDTSKIEEFV